MKKLQFIVEVEFEDKITQDSEIEEVTMNILEALKAETDNGIGLAPEESETFPTKIVVHNSVVNTTVHYDFLKQNYKS